MNVHAQIKFLIIKLLSEIKSISSFIYSQFYEWHNILRATIRIIIIDTVIVNVS